ncbi:uncharacterized protein Hap1MRO34_017076 [Clarias gariepinus]
MTSAYFSEIHNLLDEHQKGVKTIAQLKAEKADLKEHVETLRGSMQKMMNLLSESHRTCDELMTKYMRDLEVYSLHKFSYDEMGETLAHNEKFLMDSPVEADLRDQVETLRGTMQDTRVLHSGPYWDFKELQKEYEQEQEAQSLLMDKYGETKTSSLEKLLKVN